MRGVRVEAGREDLPGALAAADPGARCVPFRVAGFLPGLLGALDPAVTVPGFVALASSGVASVTIGERAKYNNHEDY